MELSAPFAVALVANSADAKLRGLTYASIRSEAREELDYSFREEGFSALIRSPRSDKGIRKAQMSLGALGRAADTVRVGHWVRADWFLLGGAGPSGATHALLVRWVDARSSVLREAWVPSRFHLERLPPFGKPAAT